MRYLVCLGITHVGLIYPVVYVGAAAGIRWRLAMLVQLPGECADEAIGLADTARTFFTLRLYYHRVPPSSSAPPVESRLISWVRGVAAACRVKRAESDLVAGLAGCPLTNLTLMLDDAFWGALTLPRDGSRIDRLTLPLEDP